MYLPSNSSIEVLARPHDDNLRGYAGTIFIKPQSFTSLQLVVIETIFGTYALEMDSHYVMLRMSLQYLSSKV